jgi:hypothetical protein
MLIKMLGMQTTTYLEVFIHPGHSSNDYAELYDLIKHWRIRRITFSAPYRNTVLDFHAWFRLAKTIGIAGVGGLFHPKSSEMIPLYSDPTLFELTSEDQLHALDYLGVPAYMDVD